MTLNKEIKGEVLIVTIPGRTIDAANASEFKSAMTPLLAADSKLVVDLEHLDFVDSTGLGALVSCLRKIHVVSGEIKLCGLTKPVRSLFELVRMHRVFEIFNDVDEAVKSYGT
jgi:anti-sigma B factor antagonist